MFRSSTILRELVQSLAKVTLLLKHSVKLRRCTLFGDVAACREIACVLFVVQTEQSTQQFAIFCSFIYVKRFYVIQVRAVLFLMLHPHNIIRVQTQCPF